MDGLGAAIDAIESALSAFPNGIMEAMNLRTVEILKSVRTDEVFLVIANIPIQAVLSASDIERARSWYSEKLGLEPISTSPFGDLRYEAGGVEFLVYQSELAGTNQATAYTGSRASVCLGS